MSTEQQDTTTATQASAAATLPARFEVTTLPVADVDRAKAFYQRLGWRLDIDFKPSPDTRGVQFTPPGSQASIQFGQGTTTMEPGSLQGLFLVVDDIVAARDDLIARGVEVGEIWHLETGKGRVSGQLQEIVIDLTGLDAAFHSLFASEEAGVADMPMKRMLPPVESSRGSGAVDAPASMARSHRTEHAGRGSGRPLSSSMPISSNWWPPRPRASILTISEHRI